MIRTDIDRHPSIARITLDRPEKRNALDAPLVRELRDRVTDLGNDPALRVIVVTGEGTAFSAGADLDALRALRTATREENLEDSLLLASLYEAVVRCPVPVIARVNGHAVAGGCGLVAASDLSIAARTAKLGFTEVRIGFVPAMVSVLLRGRLREADLRDLLLTGRLVDADEAERIGLVTRSVAPEDLDDTVFEAAARIARETSREAVARTKALLVAEAATNLGAALRAAAAVNASARSTDDCIAGIDAFLAGTKPPWRGAWDERERG
jgi:methylglutaconyl-CoA hydratase